MTLEEIQAIIRQINDSDIREINLDYQDIHLYLNKNENSHQTAETVVTRTNRKNSPEKPKTAQSAVKSEKPETEPAKQEATAIKAPLVGVIYLQPSPDKPAYKKVGDHVSAGEVVCVIEAMKMMTEIQNEVDGTISKILVENEEVVEYDQPL